MQDYMTKIEGVPGKRDIKAGMAYFAWTGPPGSIGGKCAFYGTNDFERKCTKYREMMHDWGANLKKSQAACKYFEPKQR